MSRTEYMKEYYKENKEKMDKNSMEAEKKRDNVVFECPKCGWEQDHKFKEGRTIDLYCFCNIQGRMNLSLKGDRYIKYSYLVSDIRPNYSTFKHFSDILKKQNDTK